MLKLKTQLSNQSNLVSFLTTLLVILFSAMCAIGLGAVILTAYSGVPVGDDYTAIKLFSNPDTWLENSWQSFTHTGRYMQSVVGSLAYGVFGKYIAIFLPLIVIGWVYALIYLYSRLVVRKMKLTINSVYVHLFSAASLTLFVTLGTVQDAKGVWLLYQPFYFSSAIVTYTLSALLYATLFYVFLRYWEKLRQWPGLSLGIFCVISYLTGLFNETMPATLFALSSIVLVALVVFGRRHSQRNIKQAVVYLAALCVTSIAALMTMFLSPARQARTQATGGLQDSNILSPVFSKFTETIVNYVSATDLIMITILASIVLIGLLRSKNSNAFSYGKFTLLGATTIIAGALSLLVSITLLVLGYGPFTQIYPRTFVAVQITLFAGLLIFIFGLLGLIVSYGLKKNLRFVQFALILLSLVALLVAVPHFLSKTTTSLNAVMHYHTIWVDQNNLLVDAAAKDPDTTVYLNDEGAGIGDDFSVLCYAPSSSSTSWLNDGMEAYYGLREICSKSESNSK